MTFRSYIHETNSNGFMTTALMDAKLYASLFMIPLGETATKLENKLNLEKLTVRLGLTIIISTIF